MKKIGILTFWGIPNYGTFFQAYALQNAVQSCFPQDDVKQIAYIDQNHYLEYFGIIPRGFRYSFINPNFYKALFKRLSNRKNSKLKEKRFKNYYDQINHTRTFTKDTLRDESFDVVFIGSDIVWDYSIKIFNKDKFLFGNNLKSKHIASYAASFGTVKPADRHPSYVKEGLSVLDDISVRDLNSSSIVKGLVGRDASIVLDPAFLWDFSTDGHIHENEYSDYIVVYGSFFTDELKKGAREFADSKGYKLICLDSRDDDYDWCDITIKQSDLDPFQWLSMFKFSKSVLTCTFHGLIFGLIFNKPIAFSPTQFILDKATSFMKHLDLYKVLCEETSFKGKVEWDWNYREINSKIEILKSQSFDFINKNCK